jgi:hypothetical protein
MACFGAEFERAELECAVSGTSPKFVGGEVVLQT